MNRPPFKRALRSLVTTLATTLFTSYLLAPGAYAQSNTAATTLSSKQKVSIIIDRERTPQQSTLLVKILVPDDAKVDSFMLADPPRLVVDFVGVKIKSSEVLQPPKNTIIKQIRLGAHPGKLRIVIDLNSDTPPAYEWRGGARQATLRIIESGSAAILPPPPSAAPIAAPYTPTTALPLLPTLAPTLAPTQISTVAPTPAPTMASTSTPAPMPTETVTAPTLTPTSAPARQEPQPKLPDMSDKDLEAALDQEIAKASAALARGETLTDPVELSGEDLVDGPTIEEEEFSDEGELDVPAASPTQPSLKDVAKSAGLVTKDLPKEAAEPATAPQQNSLGALRANVIPPPAVTEFTIQSIEFDYLEPDHQQALRLKLSRPGAQAQISKVDPTTYKMIIAKCGLANLGLSLPQYPPAEFKGLVLVTSKVEGDTVEITAQVEQGVSLTTLIREKEIWIKKQ